MTIKIVEAILSNVSDSGIEYHIVHLTDDTFSIVANKVQGWKFLQQPLTENPDALDERDSFDELANIIVMWERLMFKFGYDCLEGGYNQIYENTNNEKIRKVIEELINQ